MLRPYFVSFLDCYIQRSVSWSLVLLDRGDEPEPLKRLKREMGVALHEEDYVAAGVHSATLA